MPAVELSTNLLVDIGGWPALKEARVMVERGRVHDARREGDIIRARIQGAEKTNDVQIILAERVSNIEVRCTCAESRRTGRVCAHVLAAGLALLQPKRPAVAATGGSRVSISTLPIGTGGDQPVPVPSAPPAEPTIEARIEGALSGLTLELVAHYEGKSFPLSSTERLGNPSAPLRSPGPRHAQAERTALAEAGAAGFARVRGAATMSLTAERNVARFLANTLPRWRHLWTVTCGPRLQASLAEIDIAQPEFSLRSTGPGNDWLSLDLKLTVGGKPIALEQAEIQRWLQTGQSHTRTANRRVLLVPTEAWSEMQEVLADCAVDQEPGAIRIARTFAPYLSSALTAQGFLDLERGLSSLHPLAGAATLEATLDEKLLAQLRPYQAHGVQWLAGLAQQNLHGLLADDMGLGKTLQALAFTAWLHHGDASEVAVAVPSGGAPEPLLSGGPDNSLSGKARSSGTTGGRREHAQSPATSCSLRESGQQVLRTTSASTASAAPPALVICPTSLVTNWIREAARFTPHLRTLDLTGPDRAGKFARRYDHDLLVTSYAVLRRDIDQFRADEFSLVILDEAQHIKNRGSQNAQSAKALRARHRLILTGTPLENSVLDLWSLFDFLVPGYLGTAGEFKDRYETPISKAPEPKLMARLRHRVRPFFLRRTKEEVLTELPPKLDYPTLVELTDEQREVYRAVLAQGRRDVFEHSDKAGRKSGRDRLAVLTTLLRLRQVCCHLDLLPGSRDDAQPAMGDPDNSLSGSAKPTGGHREYTNPPATSCSLRESGHQVVRTTDDSPRAAATKETRWKEPSAKMERTFELIDEAIDGGHRVLLFSQFVRVLHLLREEAARRDIRFCYLDGQTTERQAEVDRFQNDSGIPLFFISLKAGGTGLNLTGADTVIHFDPWWNPAVEEQATSRAHRMGQARSVQAYKLIAAGTVEEKIQALQARKRELFQASLASDEAFVEKLTGDDLDELLA